MRRRRGEELDAAIRSAVLELLAEHGPGGVTMEAVASAAKTSKPVLYRRWPDRGALLRDTLAGHSDSRDPARGHGQLPRRHAGHTARMGGVVHRSRGGRAPGRDRGGAHTIQELTAAFQNDVIGWRKEEMAALLSRGIARGDVRSDVPVEIARELGQSVLWHRLLITGDPITDDLVVQLVDEVLVPFVAPR